MKLIKTYIISGCFCFLILFVFSFLSINQVEALTVNQQSAIQYAGAHGFLTPVVARNVNGAPLKKSLLGKIWSTIGPAILGSTGIIVGSVIAWYTLHRKRKTFATYYEQIKAVHQRYTDTLKSGTIDKTQAVKNFKSELSLIQEEAELNAAQKS